MAHVRPETWASCPGSLGSRPALPIDTCSYSYTLYHTDSHILHITHPYTHTPQQILKDPPCTLTHINYHTAQTHNTHTTISYTHTISHTHRPSYVPPPTCPQVDTPTTHTLVHTDTHTTYHKHASYTTYHHIRNVHATHTPHFVVNTSPKDLDKLSDSISVAYNVEWVLTS